VSADPIGDLVDWQLANRRRVDVIVSVCRVCLARWDDDATACPECGELQ
jgi:ribosomal protein L40E